MLKSIFLALTLIISTCNASVHDFCVADLTGPPGSSGYPCKIPEEVTVSDFIFTGFRKAGNTTTNQIRDLSSIRHPIPWPKRAWAFHGPSWPGPRGCGPHAHSPWSLGGFGGGAGIDNHGLCLSANNLYVRKLWSGDVMVLPQGLLHFQFNGGRIPALAFASFSSPNPGIKITDLALFSNDYLSSAFRDYARVKKLLKAVLLRRTR